MNIMIVVIIIPYIDVKNILEQYIASPNYPSFYPPNLHKVYPCFDIKSLVPTPLKLLLVLDLAAEFNKWTTFDNDI